MKDKFKCYFPCIVVIDWEDDIKYMCMVFYGWNIFLNDNIYVVGIELPHIDWMAVNGMSMNNFYAVQPINCFQLICDV